MRCLVALLSLLISASVLAGPTWRRLPVENPPEARMTNLVYDSNRREVVLIGGYGQDPQLELELRL